MTFREWLESEHGEKDKFVLVSKVIKEFDRHFEQRSIGDDEMTLWWIEKEKPGNE